MVLTNPAEMEVLEDGLVQSCAFIKENPAVQSLGYNLGIIHITAVPKPASPSSLPFYRWGNRSTGRWTEHRPCTWPWSFLGCLHHGSDVPGQMNPLCPVMQQRHDFLGDMGHLLLWGPE